MFSHHDKADLVSGCKTGVMYSRSSNTCRSLPVGNLHEQTTLRPSAGAYGSFCDGGWRTLQRPGKVLLELDSTSHAC